jgi:hypothetical protein
MAFAKLVLTPAAVALALYVWAFPSSQGGRLRWLPPRRSRIVIARALGILTCTLIIGAALFGVGWLVHR